jgi:hypothetical protein
VDISATKRLICSAGGEQLAKSDPADEKCFGSDFLVELTRRTGFGQTFFHSSEVRFVPGFFVCFGPKKVKRWSWPSWFFFCVRMNGAGNQLMIDSSH